MRAYYSDNLDVKDDKPPFEMETALFIGLVVDGKKIDAIDFGIARVLCDFSLYKSTKELPKGAKFHARESYYDFESGKYLRLGGWGIDIFSLFDNYLENEIVQDLDDAHRLGEKLREYADKFLSLTEEDTRS